MACLITCRDYSILRVVPAGADLPALCRAAEIEQGDTFVVFASQDGRAVADADGWIANDHSPDDPHAAAMELRFDD